MKKVYSTLGCNGLLLLPIVVCCAQFTILAQSAVAGKNISIQNALAMTDAAILANSMKKGYDLPERGLCAHRGAMAAHPENTLAAFREAIKLGAHMIEFDVWLTKDNEPVVIHDGTVDRTTDGTGKVSDFTLNEIRQLDAGSWKSPDFKGEKIPTLSETLQMMPQNIWLNVHLKGNDTLLGKVVAEMLVKENRLHQAFLACPIALAETAKSVHADIMFCIMGSYNHKPEYVDETIKMEADFIQLHGDLNPIAGYAKALKEKRIRINYYGGADLPDKLKSLIESGVDFPLVDNFAQSMKIASELGIKPWKPIFSN